jgi:protein phosphatase
MSAIELCVQSDVGRVRKQNEDYFGLCSRTQELTNGERFCGTLSSVDLPALLLVADGVGGLPGGRDASRAAVSAVAGAFLNGASTDDSLKFLQAAVAHAHSKVQDLGNRFPNCSTTLIVALMRDGALDVAHVGDSRVYLYRQGRLVQLTSDHTLVQKMVEMGQISPQEASARRDKNVLVRAVGYGSKAHEDLFHVELCRDDVLMCCTDGLHGYFDEGELVASIQGAADLGALSADLIERAKEKGGSDNITLALARFSGSGISPGADRPIRVQTLG